MLLASIPLLESSSLDKITGQDQGSMKNDHEKRIELFTEIHSICRELAYIQDGVKNPYSWRINSIKKFWIRFFGFISLQEMTAGDLDNFRALLQAKVEAEYKSKGLPLFYGGTN